MKCDNYLRFSFVTHYVCILYFWVKDYTYWPYLYPLLFTTVSNYVLLFFLGFYFDVMEITPHAVGVHRFNSENQKVGCTATNKQRAVKLIFDQIKLPKRYTYVAGTFKFLIFLLVSRIEVG